MEGQQRCGRWGAEAGNAGTRTRCCTSLGLRRLLPLLMGCPPACPGMPPSPRPSPLTALAVGLRQHPEAARNAHHDPVRPRNGPQRQAGVLEDIIILDAGQRGGGQQAEGGGHNRLQPASARVSRELLDLRLYGGRHCLSWHFVVQVCRQCARARVNACTCIWRLASCSVVCGRR